MVQPARWLTFWSKGLAPTVARHWLMVTGNAEFCISRARGPADVAVEVFHVGEVRRFGYARPEHQVAAPTPAPAQLPKLIQPGSFGRRSCVVRSSPDRRRWRLHRFNDPTYPAVEVDTRLDIVPEVGLGESIGELDRVGIEPSYPPRQGSNLSRPARARCWSWGYKPRTPPAH